MKLKLVWLIYFCAVWLSAEEISERPREEILSVINLNLPAIRYAYQKRLVENEISGVVKLWFSVDSSGVVAADSIVSSTINDTLFESAIREKVRGWIFNPCNCSEPTEIVYPFTFTSFN